MLVQITMRAVLALAALLLSPPAFAGRCNDPSLDLSVVRASTVGLLGSPAGPRSFLAAAALCAGSPLPLTADQEHELSKLLTAGQRIDWQQKFKGRALAAQVLIKLAKSRDNFPEGIQITGATIINDIDLTRAEVYHFVRLEGCRFENKVVLDKAVFYKELSLEGSCFRDTVRLNETQIGGRLNAFKTTFVKGANFSNLTVKGVLDITQAEFGGLVEFTNAEIGGDVNAKECRFKENAEFVGAGMKVARSAHFMDTTFSESADFNRIRVGIDFHAQRCTFSKGAAFNGMKAENVNFKGSHFDGPTAAVDFAYAEVGQDFQLLECQFKTGVNLASTKVGNHVFISAAKRAPLSLSGKIALSYASVLHLMLGEDRADATDVPALDLEGIEVKGQCSVLNMRVRDRLNLQFSGFQRLTLKNVSLPNHDIDINGMTYQYITSDNNDYAKILELLDKAKYNTTAYTNLETFYRRQGLRQQAVDVFQAMNVRERKEMLAQGSIVKWLWSVLMCLFVDNGASPERALFWGLGIVFFGALLFRYNKMELREEKETPGDPPAQAQATVGAGPARTPTLAPDHWFRARALAVWSRCVDWYLCEYNSFRYSLDLFVPGINLEAEKLWQPKKEEYFLLFWRSLHRILGWIIIPIGLVAMTGLVKL